MLYPAPREPRGQPDEHGERGRVGHDIAASQISRHSGKLADQTASAGYVEDGISS